MTYDFGDTLVFITPYEKNKEHNGKSCMIMKTTKLHVFRNKDEKITIPIQFTESKEKLEVLPEELHISGWFNKR